MIHAHVRPPHHLEEKAAGILDVWLESSDASADISISIFEKKKIVTRFVFKADESLELYNIRNCHTCHDHACDRDGHGYWRDATCMASKLTSRPDLDDWPWPQPASPREVYPRKVRDMKPSQMYVHAQDPSLNLLTALRTVPETPLTRSATSVLAAPSKAPSFAIDSSNKTYKHQYANIYFVRLRLLRSFVEENAKRLWKEVAGAQGLPFKP